MSKHDESKRGRKIDAIKGGAPRQTREFYEAELLRLLTKDSSLMERAAQLHIMGIGHSLLIHEMADQALGDARTVVNLTAYLNQIALRVISKYEVRLEVAYKRDSSFRISFASDLTDDQFSGALRAVADYYRACGGAGLSVEFDPVEVSKFGVV